MLSHRTFQRAAGSRLLREGLLAAGWAAGLISSCCLAPVVAPAWEEQAFGGGVGGVGEGLEPRSPAALPGERETNVCCLKPLTRWSCLWPLERMTNFRRQHPSVSPAGPGCSGLLAEAAFPCGGRPTAELRASPPEVTGGLLPCVLCTGELGAESGEDLFWCLPDQRRATDQPLAEVPGKW